MSYTEAVHVNTPQHLNPSIINPHTVRLKSTGRPQHQNELLTAVAVRSGLVTAMIIVSLSLARSQASNSTSMMEQSHSVTLEGEKERERWGGCGLH